MKLASSPATGTGPRTGQPSASEDAGPTAPWMPVQSGNGSADSRVQGLAAGVNLGQVATKVRG